MADDVGPAESGDASYSFTEIYNTDDATLIDIASIATSDATVTGPGGVVTVVVTAVPTGGINAAPLTVTYTITPPSGAWDDSDNGSYSIAINASEVGDDGAPQQFLAANPLLVSFNVNVPETDLVATVAGGTGSDNQSVDTSVAAAARDR